MDFKKRLRRLAIFCALFALTLAAAFGPFSAKAWADDSLDVKAKSAILVDYNTGQILFEKDADHIYPPASMTKMMTEYLVMKALHSGKISWNTKVNVSDYAYKISQNRSFSNVPLKQDYQYTVRELYEAMAIYSANGATIALAEKLGGSEKNFVDLMNQTAKKLGMTHAHYINSSGLDNVDLGKYAPYGGKNDSNELSARDIAKLAYHIVKDYPEALHISKVPLKKFTAGVDKPIQMVNWNYMLPGFGTNMNKFKYTGVDGLKTGHTDLAGYCFTGTVSQNGHRLISVVMGTSSDDERFQQTKKLFDYGYQQFTKKTIVKKYQAIKGESPLPVENGKKANVHLGFGKTLKFMVPSDVNNQYTFKVHLDRSKLNKNGKLEAPVNKGEKLGYATLSAQNGAVYGYLYNKNVKVPVVASEQVDRTNWFILLFKGIGHFFANLFGGIVHLF